MEGHREEEPHLTGVFCRPSETCTCGVWGLGYSCVLVFATFFFRRNLISGVLISLSLPPGSPVFCLIVYPHVLSTCCLIVWCAFSSPPSLLALSSIQTK